MGRADDVDRHVGREIRRHRKALGLSMNALGTALNMSRAQVAKYERGPDRVKAGELHRIARVLGCNVADFFPPIEDGAADDMGAELIEMAAGMRPADRRKVGAMARLLAKLGRGV